MHAICRLTPYPVTRNWTVGKDFAMFKCLDAPNLDLLASVRREKYSFTKATSPWNTPQADCHWPVDLIDQTSGYLCSLDGAGFHQCIHDYPTLPEQDWRWCGADFDAWGNYRFVREFHIFDYSLYVLNLNFGFMNFDHVGKGLLFIFQSLSTNNWSYLMYNLMDANSTWFGAGYSVSMIFIGTFICLQLILATLANTLREVSKLSVEELIEIDSDPLEPRSDKSEYPCVIAVQDMLNKLDGATLSWRSVIMGIVETPWYDTTVTGLVFVNAMVLATNHYPASNEFVDSIDAINFVLTLCFCLDCSAKVLAYGLFEYLRDMSNCLDGMVVFVSTIDIATSPTPVLFSHSPMHRKESGALSALRTFRIFALFRLVKAGPLKRLFEKVGRCVMSISNFFVLVLLYLFVFTLIGMNFFANKMRFDGNGFLVTSINSEEFFKAPYFSRYNFDDFTHSLATNFQIITFDNWIVILVDCMRAYGAAGFLFPIACVIIGQSILFNMFLALLIQGFDHKDSDEGASTSLVTPTQRDHSAEVILDSRQQHTHVTRTENYCNSKYTKFNTKFTEEAKTVAYDGDVARPHSEPSFGERVILGPRVSPSLTHSSVTVAMTEDGKDAGQSQQWGSFQWCSRVKQLALFIVTHDCFEALITAFIIMSCVALALSTPLLNPDGPLVRSLHRIDVVLLVVFIVEMTLKLFAFGIVSGESSYFRDPWNWLDCFVVVTSVVFIAGSGSTLSRLKVLRVLRALRPLRLINKIPGVRKTFVSLIKSLPDVRGVLIIFFAIHFVFAIFLVSFFRGQYRSCQGDVFSSVVAQNQVMLTLLEHPRPWTLLTEAEKSVFGPNSPAFTNLTVSCSSGSLTWPIVPCAPYEAHALKYMDAIQPTSRMICELWGGKWLPFHDRLWDNVPQAMLGLFQLSTLEGWVDNMWACVDCRGIDMQPIRDANVAWVYFWIVFVLIGSFFATNLFVAAITESFLMNSRVNGSNFMTDDQIAWANAQRLILRIKPMPIMKCTPGLVSEACFRICQHPHFENCIAAVIGVQYILLLAAHFGQSDDVTAGLENMNSAIGIIFVVEFLIKLKAYGHKNYFRISWNRFECFVAILSLVGVIDIFVWPGPIGLVGNLIRILQAFRLMRLGSQHLRDLFTSLILSLPGIMNVLILLIMGECLFYGCFLYHVWMSPMC